LRVKMTLPEELIPVNGYDFEVTGPNGFDKTYSLPNTHTGEAVLDGLTNGTEYMVKFHTFATCGSSPESDPVKAKPSGPKPGAPIILDVTAHWNGVKIMFDDPKDFHDTIVDYVASVDGENTKVENVTGKQGEMHTGFITSDPGKHVIALAAVNTEKEPGALSETHTVTSGPAVFTPSGLATLNVPSEDRTALFNSPKSWSSETGFTGVEIVATPQGGGEAVVKLCPVDTQSGTTGVLGYDKKYDVGVRLVYPNGKSALSKTLTITMWPHFVKTGPTVKVDATGNDRILVSQEAVQSLPCKAFEVWIDGHPVGVSTTTKSTVTVTSGYSGGVECSVSARWVEVDDQYSDQGPVVKVTPSAPAPAVPILGQPAQRPDAPDNQRLAFFPVDGATKYMLYWREKGQTGWPRSTDVTSSVNSWKLVDVVQAVAQQTMFFEYTATAGNASGTSAFSGVENGIMDPYLPPQAPGMGSVQIIMQGDSLIISCDPSKFTTGDFTKHFSGIVAEYSINGGDKKTKVLPTNWEGSTDWWGAGAGQSLEISFAAQIWGRITGQMTTKQTFNRPTTGDIKPEVVNVASPKAAS